MAGDNTSDPSSLPLARYPTSSPQQQASDHNGGSTSLKVSKGHVISRSYGAQHYPQCDQRSDTCSAPWRIRPETAPKSDSSKQEQEHADTPLLTCG